MVDEAHSIGVLGRTGRAIEEHFGLGTDCLDIKMGTLSKAIPSVGGYVAANRKPCHVLRHQIARVHLLGGAPALSSRCAALTALAIIEREPERVRRVHDNARHFAQGLERAGLPYLNRATAILPIICGGNWQAWRMARSCQRRGVHVQAIPHPVVPRDTVRLRAAVSAAHTREDLDHCLSVLSAAAARSA